MFLEREVNLRPLSSFRIGGPAKLFHKPKDIQGVVSALEEAKRIGSRVFILGGGTNILWSDDGFDGLVLKPNLLQLTRGEDGIEAGAGLLMSELLSVAAADGLTGLEWAGGLPGTLGGAVRGNAGAFGGEIKDSVKWVTSLDINTLKIIKRSNAECEFGYRTSVFKTKDDEIILEVVLGLVGGSKEDIHSLVRERIDYRHTRHPMEHPNIGSIFKNVSLTKHKKLDLERFRDVIKNDPFPVIPTAFLISECKLKGVSCGGAMISPKHPNFIVNVLNAEANDVKSLINLTKEKVYTDFKIKLEEEILIF